MYRITLMFQAECLLGFKKTFDWILKRASILKAPPWSRRLAGCRTYLVQMCDLCLRPVGLSIVLYATDLLIRDTPIAASMPAQISDTLEGSGVETGPSLY